MRGWLMFTVAALVAAALCGAGLGESQISSDGADGTMASDGSPVGLGDQSIGKHGSPSAVPLPSGWLIRWRATSGTDGDALCSLANEDGTLSTAADLTQGTSSACPRVRKIGSEYSIEFDGATDWMGTSTWTAETTPYVCAVLWCDDVASQDIVFDGDNATNRILMQQTATPQWGIGSTAAFSTGTPVANRWELVCGLWNNTSSTIEINGSTPVTGSAGAGTFDGLTLGALYLRNANFWDGRMREVVFWGTKPDETELAAYWADAFGTFPISVSAPTGTVPSSKVYTFDGWNIDDEVSYSTKYAAADLVTTWNNLGTGGNATQATATQKPTYSSSDHALLFDGSDQGQTADNMTIASSDSGAAFIHTTAIFEIVVIFRQDVKEARSLLWNASGDTEKGIQVNLTATGAAQVAIYLGGGSTAVSATSTFTYGLGEWGLLGVRGDGSTLRISDDLTTWETAAISATTIGNASNVMKIGSDGADEFDGAIGLLLIDDAELSAGERTNILTVAGRWGLTSANSYRKSVTTYAAMGDSQTLGLAAHTNAPWSSYVEALTGVAIGNHGVSGERCTAINTRWAGGVDVMGYDRAIVQCGVNNINLDGVGAGATAWSEIQTLVSNITGTGATAYVIENTPWASFAGWSSAKQVETEALNASIAAGSGFTFVQMYTELEGAADTCANCSDGLHRNTTGSRDEAKQFLGLGPSSSTSEGHP